MNNLGIIYLCLSIVFLGSGAVALFACFLSARITREEGYDER